MLPKFLRLPVFSLLAFIILIAAVALPRRSAADSRAYCLQLRMPDERRHLIDTRSGDRAYLRTDLYKIWDGTVAPAISPDGTITAYISNQTVTANGKAQSLLWLDGVGITDQPLLQLLPWNQSITWISDRLLFFSSRDRQAQFVGSVSVLPDGQINLNTRTFTYNASDNSAYERMWGNDYLLFRGKELTIWQAVSNTWVDIQLPDWIAAQTILSPFVKLDNEHLALSQQLTDRTALLLTDLSGGDQIMLRYPRSERVLDVNWSPGSKYAMIKIDKGGEERLDLWALPENDRAPQRLQQWQAVDSDQSQINWLWSADGGSAIYWAYHDNQIEIQRYWLDNRQPEPIFSSNSVKSAPTLITTHLLFTLQRDQAYDTVMIDRDGQITTLLHDLPMNPFFTGFASGYASYHWSDARKPHLVFVDLASLRWLEVLGDEMAVSVQSLQFQVMGDVVIAQAKTIFGMHYVAVNLKRLEQFPLTDADEYITSTWQSYQTTSFNIQWESKAAWGKTLFAPDGTRLAVFVGGVKGIDYYYKVSPDTTGLIILDSTTLKKLYVLRNDGTAVKPRVTSPIRTMPTWSPDSSKIVAIVDQQAPQDDVVLLLDAAGNLLAEYPAHGDATIPIWTACQ